MVVVLFWDVRCWMRWFGGFGGVEVMGRWFLRVWWLDDVVLGWLCLMHFFVWFGDRYFVGFGIYVVYC